MAFQYLGMMMVRIAHWKHFKKKKGDITIVIEDYSAATNSELTVQKGQHVEIIDPAPGEPNWCMVRAITSEEGEPCQGLVPMAALKPLPTSRRPGSRSSMDLEEAFGADTSPSSSIASLNSSSPVAKRRSSFRKWLTTPVRKLSQTKIEKPGLEKSAMPSVLDADRVPVGLIGKDQPNGDRLVATHVPTVTQKPNLEVTNEEQEPAEDIELPPPMDQIEHRFGAPTQEGSPDDIDNKLASTLSIKATTDGLATLDIASDLEHMVKQRMDNNSDSPNDQQASSESGGENNDDPTIEPGEAKKNKYLTKRWFVVQELIDTERDYVKDLGLIVEGYMKYMKENGLPEDMDGKDKIVFGNIHQIFDWHKETFQQEIEKCLDEPERLGILFTRYDNKLRHMYVKYCENKPKSEYIVAEYVDSYFEDLRLKLGHRLQLPDLLIKPVQRIMKYQLLLRDITVLTEKAGLDTTMLQKGLAIMCVVPKAANDMMQVGRLQGFDGNITALGKLLLQDTVSMAENSPGASQQKFKERRVFLFEQMIIFGEIQERKRGNISNENYIYKNRLMVNKMSMTENVKNEPLRFILLDRTPGSELSFTIQCSSEEVKASWVVQIKSLLDKQRAFVNELVNPLSTYQNKQKELTKELSAPEIGSITRDSQLRKTQSQPHPGKGVDSRSKTPPDGQTKGRQESQKHTRCKSVPGPLIDKVNEGNEYDEPQKMSSCPNSADCDKVIINPCQNSSALLSLGGSGVGGGGSSDASPKPKRNILGVKSSVAKSKTDTSSGKELNTNASGGVPPDVVQDSNIRNFSNDPSMGGGGDGASRIDPVDNTEGEHNSHDSVVHIGKIICDYQAVREDEISVCKGEIVQILSTNQYNLFFVYRPANVNSPAAEGWIPGHVIGPKDSEGSLRKSSWQLFKLRMQGLRPERRGMDGMNSIERKSKTLPMVRERSNKTIQQDLLYEMSPTVHQPLTSVIVQAGDTAVLTCRICGRPRPNISWRFKESISLSSGPRFHINYSSDDVASLQILNVSLSDSGEYTCIASSDIGTVITKAVLTVLDRPAPPSKPVIRNQVGTSVHLEWSPPPTLHCGQIQGYTIEFKELGIEMWQAAVPYVPNTSQVIGDLSPGSTYQFRVSANNNIGMSDPSLSSDFIEIPTENELSDRDDNACTIWKSTFENDFSEIDEISRGRFAVVKRCVQKCSGQEFAAKFVNRRTICKEAIETEFNTLQSLQHENLIQVYDLYEMPVNFILLMQLLPLGRLFEYISSKTEFDEHEAANFIRQLLSVLKYLHNCRIAHLDIKPENLLLVSENPDMCLKLIDFGDARHIFNNYYIHTIFGNPEFLAPEIIAGTPVGLSTDMWSVGVVMYVLLSGVSPFLDESQEETCSNILNIDYCFPSEYFDGISSEAKEMITSILIEDLRRPSAQSLLDHPWLNRNVSNSVHGGKISTIRLADFIERRKHQGDSCIIGSPS